MAPHKLTYRLSGVLAVMLGCSSPPDDADDIVVPDDDSADQSCVGATLDASGACRTPSGQFAAKACCEVPVGPTVPSDTAILALGGSDDSVAKPGDVIEYATPIIGGSQLLISTAPADGLETDIELCGPWTRAECPPVELVATDSNHDRKTLWAIAEDGWYVSKTTVSSTPGLAPDALQKLEQDGASVEVRSECAGGRCENLPAPELDEFGADDCMAQARTCTLERRADVASGTAAKLVFAECLSNTVTLNNEQAFPPPACTATCDIAIAACERITERIEEYAAESAECVATLQSCLSDCHAIDDAAVEAAGIEREDNCWGGGDDCDGYAQAHDSCGGALSDGSQDACKLRCAAVEALWLGDARACEEANDCNNLP